jgi:hypothetical protein
MPNVLCGDCVTHAIQGCQMAYFLTKNLIWVNFVGSCNGRYWYILWPFGIFYRHYVSTFCGHLVYLTTIMWVYFMAIWYILPPLGIFCSHLVYFTAIWHILPPFGIFCAHLVYICRLFGIFFLFWYVLQRKIWQPWLDPLSEPSALFLFGSRVTRLG